MTPFFPDPLHTMSRVRRTLSIARRNPGTRHDGAESSRAATGRLALAAVLIVALGCATGQAAPVTNPAPRPGTAAATPGASPSDTSPLPGMLSLPNANPFPSTYAAFPSRTTVIRGATILTSAGPVLHDASILLRDGKIVSVGSAVDAPPDAVVIDGHGRYVTPGIIDVHSHMGVYAAPGVDANSDGNEATDPTTPYVWAEHSVWPQDPYFPRALAGGVTTVQILPGSANLIGGRSAILKVVPSRTVQGMKFPGAKYGLKMACGENLEACLSAAARPVHPNGQHVAGLSQSMDPGGRISTPVGQVECRPQGRPAAPRPRVGDAGRGAACATSGRAHMHCYRADEMAQTDRRLTRVRIPDPWRFTIRSRRTRSPTCWRRTGSAPREVGGLGRIQDGVVRCDSDESRVDGPGRGQGDDPFRRSPRRPALESGSRQGDERRRHAATCLGIPVTEEQAVKWMTINPAWALGLDDKIGSLEAGKDADVVLWSGDPFSVYEHADKVWIEGALLYDRSDPAQQWRTDFELGYVPADTALATGGAPR